MKKICYLFILSIVGIIAGADNVHVEMIRPIKISESIVYLADDTGEEFVLDRVEPRIFTPEEEDTNINRVRFYFNGTDYFGEVIISIFDTEGREIRGSLDMESSNVMVWDGRDENNEIVKGGIYIYQIEAEGQIINGTIVVAK